MSRSPALPSTTSQGSESVVWRRSRAVVWQGWRCVVAATLASAITFGSACGGTDRDSAVELSSAEAPDTPSSEAPDTGTTDLLEAPPEGETGPSGDAALPDLTGIWTVVAHHMPGTAALTEAEATAWHGRTLRLEEREAISPGNRCEAPAYATRSAPTDSLLGIGFNLAPGSLAPLATTDVVTLLVVSCNGTWWTAMGGLLIGLDPDRALAPWDGVFFELVRDRDAEEVDFRAVGQEPGWVLEITEGESIHFTYAYGEREAYAPVPRPEIDPATGTVVYHAVTEAHDLGVTIERTPCVDVMSGAAHETTVTVTLNGETYRGCGGRL